MPTKAKFVSTTSNEKQARPNTKAGPPIALRVPDVTTSAQAYGKGMLVALAAQLVAMTSSLLIIVIAARWVPKDELGAYFFSMVVIQFAVTIGDLGLRNTAIKFVTEAELAGDFSLSQYIVNVAIARSLITAAALLALSPVIYQHWPSLNIPYLLPLVAVLAGLTVLQQIAISVSAARKQFSIMGKVSAGGELLRLFVTIAALQFGFGILGMLVGIIVCRLAVLTAFVIRNKAILKPCYRHAQARALLKFGGWLYLASIISVLIVRSTDVFLVSTLGSVVLATYSVAIQIPQALSRLFESARPAFLGYASQTHAEPRQVTYEAARILLAMVCVCAVIMIAFSEKIIIVGYSEQFRDSVPILGVLAIWICVHLTTYMYSISLTGQGYGRALIFMQMPQAIVLACSLPWAVPAYGAIGGAWCLFGAAIAGNFTGAYKLGRGQPGLSLDLVVLVLKSTVPLIVLFLVVDHYEPSILTSIALALGFVATYWALNILRGEDFLMIRTLLLRRS